MVRKGVVPLVPGCLPSLHSVSVIGDTESGPRFGGDRPNQRSSSSSVAFEPPLASVEGTVYTLEREAYKATAAGRLTPAPTTRRKKLPKGWRTFPQRG